MEAWSEKGPVVGPVPSVQMILQVKILVQRIIYYKVKSIPRNNRTMCVSC